MGHARKPQYRTLRSMQGTSKTQVHKKPQTKQTNPCCRYGLIRHKRLRSVPRIHVQKARVDDMCLELHLCRGRDGSISGSLARQPSISDESQDGERPCFKAASIQTTNQTKQKRKVDGTWGTSSLSTHAHCVPHAHTCVHLHTHKSLCLCIRHVYRVTDLCMLGV